MMTIALIVLIGLRSFFCEGAFFLTDTVYDLVFCGLFFIYSAINKKKIFLPPFVLLFLLFLIGMLISVFYSVNPYLSQKTVLGFFVLYFVCVFACGLAPAERKILLGVLVLAGAVQGARSLYQYFVGIDYILSHFSREEITRSGFYAWDLLRQKRAVGWFSAPNILGAYLLLFVPVLLSGYREFSRANNRLMAWLCLLLFAGFFVVIAFLKTAGVYLAFMISAVIFILLRNAGGRGLTGKKTVFSVVVFLLVAMVFAAAIKPRLRSFTDSAYAENSLKQRMNYWSDASRMIAAFPQTGVGPGNFGTLYPRFKAAQANETIYAHNFILQICAESGFFSTVFFLCGLSLLFIRAGKDLRKNYLRVGMISGVSAFLLFNLVDYSFFVKQCAYAFWALMGMLAGEVVSDDDRKRSGPFPVLVLTVFFIYAMAAKSELCISRAEKFFERAEYSKSIVEGEKALFFAPLNDYAYYLQALSHAKRSRDFFCGQTLQCFQSAICCNPEYAFYYFELAQYLFHWGRRPQADYYAAQALRRYPNNPQFLILKQKIISQ